MNLWLKFKTKMIKFNWKTMLQVTLLFLILILDKSNLITSNLTNEQLQLTHQLVLTAKGKSHRKRKVKLMLESLKLKRWQLLLIMYIRIKRSIYLIIIWELEQINSEKRCKILVPQIPKVYMKQRVHKSDHRTFKINIDICKRGKLEELLMLGQKVKTRKPKKWFQEVKYMFNNIFSNRIIKQPKWHKLMLLHTMLKSTKRLYPWSKRRLTILIRLVWMLRINFALMEVILRTLTTTSSVKELDKEHMQ